jgi:glycosyltransferase XagB
MTPDPRTALKFPQQAAPADAAWARAMAEGYGRLIGPAVPEAKLRHAVTQADAWGVSPHDALLAPGLVSPGDYAAALAASLGVGVVPHGPVPDLLPRRTVLLDATLDPPERMRIRVEALRRYGQTVLLAPRALVEAWNQRISEAARLDAAVFGLQRDKPDWSAAMPAATWQLVASAILVGLVVGGVCVAPSATRAALMGAIAVPFFFVVLLRVLALGVALARPRFPAAQGARIDDRALPVYSILVPLFREAAVLPGLIKALSRIDYPAAKLDCILVLEQSDAATLAAVRAIALPPSIRVVVVPAASPQTKPKALNFALPLARGRYVAVYDAEDVPAPSQLRQVLAVFASYGKKRRGGKLACVQARLNIDNANDSWLTRQFTLEYTALFDGMLPALVRMGLAVPLGGTSNHFPVDVLRELGGWDPYNVTEDADLGLRIARAGMRVAVVSSTTWEEAPVALRPWLAQRTRWLKGWMQTWLVHMRRPGRLWRDLGAWRFLGVQALIGGMVLSALAHPVFYLLLAVEVAAGRGWPGPDDAVEWAFVCLAGFNLAAGFGSAVLLAAVTVFRRKRLWLLPHIVLMPVYWLLISAASYRAAWQLFRDPYLWEKTEHRARKPGGSRH